MNLVLSVFFMGAMNSLVMAQSPLAYSDSYNLICAEDGHPEHLLLVDQTYGREQVSLGSSRSDEVIPMRLYSVDRNSRGRFKASLLFTDQTTLVNVDIRPDIRTHKLKGTLSSPRYRNMVQYHCRHRD